MKKKTLSKALMYAGLAVGGYLVYQHFFKKQAFAAPRTMPQMYPGGAYPAAGPNPGYTGGVNASTVQKFGGDQ